MRYIITLYHYHIKNELRTIARHKIEIMGFNFPFRSLYYRALVASGVCNLAILSVCVFWAILASLATFDRYNYDPHLKL